MASRVSELGRQSCRQGRGQIVEAGALEEEKKSIVGSQPARRAVAGGGVLVFRIEVVPLISPSRSAS